MLLIILSLCLTVETNIVYAGNKEHVHIKLHIPQLVKKHTHFQTVYKHHFHPKKSSYKTVHRLDPEISLPIISVERSILPSTSPSFETKALWESPKLKTSPFNERLHDLEIEMYKQLWQKEADKEFKYIGKLGKSNKENLVKLTNDHSFKSSDLYNVNDDHEFMIMDSRCSFKEPKCIKANYNTYKPPAPTIHDNADDDDDDDNSYSMYAPSYREAPTSDYLKQTDYHNNDHKDYKSNWDYASSASNVDTIASTSEYQPPNWPISSPGSLESVYSTLPKNIDHELTSNYDHLNGHYSKATTDEDSNYQQPYQNFHFTKYPRIQNQNYF